MADVARLAGVSHQTVSRVVNGHPNVRAATVERVRRAIEETGYRRNSTARALATSRTNVLGVIASETALYGPAQTLVGIERAAREAGYFLTVVSLDHTSRDSAAEAVDHLIQQSVEGCVAITPQRRLAERLTAPDAPRPLVMVEGGEDWGLPVVCVDQAQGAAEAVEHLLGLGHRTVHHIEGNPLWPQSRARLAGWRRALAGAGAPAPATLHGDWSPRSGYEQGRALLARRAAGEPVTAVFVGNDQMAVGVLRALGEARLDVPGDVSVVGFDDVPEAEFLSPALTTVRQDFARVGQESLSLLLQQVGGADTAPRADLRRMVPARLLPRGSSGPAPAPDVRDNPRKETS
ncbi:LacI family transcriptional regulator [Nocardiopsis terrae]|uniref:DNA-binding LacI/PurR family transcriptional regulator n=1 Tax=Nocardiopsis terrae TaxID=372655 RepID=A0ABR9HIA3_9ACTN|nr:LacI family DNA-binding transcriptional regulator [Nocardiopsis terrae]MBE1458666.1 DNA-binding LacI/PurR family transcriptional regulator [Nocardiopsis terrae]GHC79169.1 LacI family transcriptional regulator [Nocardiopsis terrae]